MYSVLIPSDTARKSDIRFTCHTTGQQHMVFEAAVKEGLEAHMGISEYPHKEITPSFEDYASMETMRAFIRSKVGYAKPYIDASFREGGQFGAGA